MISVYLKTDIELILGVVTLNRCKTYLHRNVLAFVIEFHCICHFRSHCHDSVARHGKKCVHKLVLILAGLVPSGVIILALTLSYLRFDIQHSALVIPSVRKAVNDNNTVLAHRLCSRLSILYVSCRRIGRCERSIKKAACFKVCSVSVKAATLMLSVDKSDLAPIPCNTIAEIKRRK